MSDKPVEIAVDLTGMAPEDMTGAQRWAYDAAFGDPSEEPPMLSLDDVEEED